MGPSGINFRTIAFYNTYNTGVRSKSSCRGLLKKFDILIVPCQYVPLLVVFVMDNVKNFQTHLSIHGADTKNRALLYRSVINLTCFQMSVFYAGTNIFSNLPTMILNLRDDKFHFKVALWKYLFGQSYYLITEFQMYRRDETYGCNL
jgi:hypothetical protein